MAGAFGQFEDREKQRWARAFVQQLLRDESVRVSQLPESLQVSKWEQAWCRGGRNMGVAIGVHETLALIIAFKDPCANDNVQICRARNTSTPAWR